MKVHRVVGSTTAMYNGSIGGYPPKNMPEEGWSKFIPMFITCGMLEEGDDWPKFIPMFIIWGMLERGMVPIHVVDVRVVG